MKSNLNLLHNYICALDMSLDAPQKKNTFSLLNTFLKVLIEQDNFLDIFCRQRLTLTQKKDCFFSLLSMKSYPELSRFFSLFLNQDRFFLFSQLQVMVENHLSVLSNECKAVLEIPFKLDVENLNSFTKSFEAKINRKLNVSVVENQSLLGGFKLTLPYIVYDMSFKSQLDIFQNSISQSNFIVGELS